MGKKKPQPIRSDINRCRACGDPAVTGKKHCKTCNDEIEFGIIPPLRPGKMLGTGNSEPWKHDSAYHGEQGNGEF